MPNVDTGSFFGSPILQSFYKVCLAIDFVIYNLISWLYTVFITIAKARLFTSETIKPFIDRIYLIIGVGALFFAAYTFLTIIANPDNLTKGNSSPTKAIRNIILAIIAITFIPTIFNFAYSVQSSIIDNNVIGRVFMTRDEQLMDDSEQNLMEFGVTMFEASFYVKNDDGSDDAQAVKSCYAQARKDVLLYNDVSYYGACVDGVTTRHIQYNFILSGIMGIIIVYVFFTYCFDIGLRAIKLTFLQIISPVPCLLLMVPGQDKMFKTWLKDTLKTFFEVFLKIFLVVFCVYMIQLLRQWFDTSDSIIFSGVSIAVINFAKLFLFLGVVMFMRKAPKLIEDAIGIKMDPKGLSLKQKLTDSGITALVGANAGMVAGAYSSIKGAKARGGNKFGAAVSGVFHGARLGGKAGWEGSLTGIGDAYNYGWANQQAWSHMDPSKGKLRNGIVVAGEMLRDNFGFQSYYDDLKDQARIEHDVQTAKNNKKIQAIDKEYTAKAKQLDGVHEFDDRSAANESFMKAATKASDTSKSEIYKDGYGASSTGKTRALIPRYIPDHVVNGATVPGHYEIVEDFVSASQFASIKDTLADAISKGELINGEQNIRESLAQAEKVLVADFDSDTLISSKRDSGAFAGVTSISGLHFGGTTDQDKMYTSFVQSYAENMKQQLVFDPATRQIRKFDDLSNAQQQALETKWISEGADRFEEIVFKNPSDHKTNVSHANELLSVLDLASIASRTADSRGYIRDAAGQKYDSTTGRFTVDPAVAKISVDIDQIVSGSDIAKAIKAVKNADVNGERTAEYRRTNIVVDGVTMNMAQTTHIKQSLVDENAKLDKDLETKILSYKPDEQASEAARKIAVRKHESKKNN